MHRIARHLNCSYKKYQNLAYNFDLMRYLVLCCFSSGIQQTMVLRMVFKWQLRLVSRFKGSFFTPQHHLIAITLPHFLIHAYVKDFKSKLLAHMQGGLMLPIRVYETCVYPLHMVKYLGKQHESKKISLNIFINRLSSITKKREIESPSLVLDN